MIGKAIFALLQIVGICFIAKSAYEHGKQIGYLIGKQVSLREHLRWLIPDEGQTTKIIVHKPAEKGDSNDNSK